MTNWNSDECEKRHAAIWNRMWWMVGVITTLLFGMGTWVYTQTTTAAKAAEEAKSKASLTDQAEVFLRDKLDTTNIRLIHMEGTLQTISTSLSRLEGRLESQNTLERVKDTAKANDKNNLFKTD